MFIENKYETTPMFGVIQYGEKKRFNDCNIFKTDLWKYAVLSL